MRVSSMTNTVELRQDPRPLVIGERLNVMGSAASKKCMMDNDVDGLVAIARQQVEQEGAHCLDVCMANTEGIDEMDLMLRLVKRLSLDVPAPIVIDSTESDVIREAVRQTPGLPIINSISLEEGRFDENAETMRAYGCPAIAMCAGPQGVVKTAVEKVQLAREIYERATTVYGLRPWQLMFDPSAFTLCTGDADLRHTAVETLDAITQIKQLFPDSYTSLGLSNVSFGLAPPARRVLNSVFLHHAIKYGLDAAIINMSRITAYADIPQDERVLAERVIFDRDDDAESDFITHFEQKSESGSGGGAAKAAGRTDLDVANQMPLMERCNYKVVHRVPDGLPDDVRGAIYGQLEGSEPDDRQKVHDAALRVLNDSLLPAMKTVGDKFGSGELILPYVLQSAECMKRAVGELETHLISTEGASKGVIVLGTVYGDVHDIGKNLVKTIMQNNGYTVHDLGKQVPISVFAEKIKETGADAVGLSALLVSTSKQMQLFAQYAQDHGLDIPILCGGAAINSGYVNRIAASLGGGAGADGPGAAAKDGAAGGMYAHGLFYCRDMFDGLHVMDGLVSDKDKVLQEYHARLSEWSRKDAKRSAAGLVAGASSGSSSRNAGDTREKSITPLLDAVRRPQSLGLGEVRHIRGISFAEHGIWDMIDKKSLFKLSWGVRGRSANADTAAEFEKKFIQWQDRIADAGWFANAYAAYGFFRCRSSGDVLRVWDDKNRPADFAFPRTTRGASLCLADYFNSDRDDIVALQVVTVGSEVADAIDQYNRKDQYTDSYYLHGMAVEAAEGLAEFCNRQVSSELGLSKALRYSWGYPSCPDTAQHRLVWQLLKPDDALQLTDAGQITPEFSTAAIVVQHPDAKYFVP